LKITAAGILAPKIGCDAISEFGRPVVKAWIIVAVVDLTHCGFSVTGTRSVVYRLITASQRTIVVSRIYGALLGFHDARQDEQDSNCN
jgi:hypothetical protein